MAETLLTMSIAEALRRLPNLAQFLADQGVPLEGPSAHLDQMRLGTALQAVGISRERFLAACKSAAEASAEVSAPVDLQADGRRIRFYANFPCPLKVPLERAMQKLLAAQQPTEDGFLLDGCSQLDFDKIIGQAEDPDELPDLILSKGRNQFLSHRFRQKFLDTGVFHRWAPAEGNPRLAAIGISDPEGFFRVIAVNPFVMVVDRTRIGSRPLPKSWRDLCDPAFAGTTTLCGHGGEFNNLVLFMMNQMVDKDAFEQFAASVKRDQHPAEFIKNLGSGRPETPAIGLLPLFFAKTARDPENSVIVWPTEGVFATPLFLLAKERSFAKVEAIARFLTGPEAAKICAGAFFPANYPGIFSDIPEHVTFLWPGWPSPTDPDPLEAQVTIQDHFKTAWNRKRQSDA